MLSIHPFRFPRAYRKGHELDVDCTIPRHFRLSRNVAVCRSLRNVRIRSQIGNRSRFDRQTFVTGFSGKLSDSTCTAYCVDTIGHSSPQIPTAAACTKMTFSVRLKRRLELTQFLGKASADIFFLSSDLWIFGR